MEFEINTKSLMSICDEIELRKTPTNDGASLCSASFAQTYL